MNAANPTYQMTPLAGVIRHAASRFWLVRDIDVDEPIEKQRLIAHIRSGDYFGVLASDLDEISQAIGDNNQAQSIMLQHVIDNLLYLERHYQIRPK